VQLSLKRGDAVIRLPLRPLFTLTIFLGSFLLFLTQPMVARMAMPRLGGAPSVWNSAMLLYQALLLAGYAYAHLLGRLPTRGQLALHLGLFGLAALTLPVGLAAITPPAGAEPALWVLWLLGATIAPLFFVIAAQAPLMQAWFARSGDPGAHDPYFLYAASNLGSFAGLLAYPLLFEPFLTLPQQSAIWSGGYLLLAAGVVLCGLAVPRAPGVREHYAAAAPLGWRRTLRWILLAAVPCGLLLSSTMHLTTEVLAAPFLWVIPLGIYLLTFVLAFGRRGRLARSLIAAAPFVLLLLGATVLLDGKGIPLILALAGLVLLFFAALGLHARLADDRPGPERLTEFYLCMSSGGVLGGVFAALIAPTLFNWTWEHPLLVLAAAALLPVPAIFGKPEEPMPLPQLVGIPVVALGLSLLADSESVTGLPRWAGLGLSAVIAWWTLRSATIRWRYAVLFGLLMMSYGGWTALARSFEPNARERSYFGIYGVETTRDGAARYLRHGTTMHGIQMLDPSRATLPGSYYAPGSAVGLAFGDARRLYGPGARLGLIGLGTGTLACYARPGQQWTAFEIDPLIVRIARDARQFSFLSRCKPDLDVVIGDARLMLDERPDDSFDLLAVDAFSSDAIPMHLMTLEAFALYDRVLADDGLLLVHISNRYLDLEPVIAAAAARGGWHALLRDYRPGAEENAMLASRSIWVALSRDPAMLDRLSRDTMDDASGWRGLNRRAGFRAWTDDFGSVLPVLK
jgi:SAM-dependent methyltransferase